MSTTKNLGLIKPELTDPADITIYNDNWDIIDVKLGTTKPIEDGGTGATTVNAARENLGVYSKDEVYTKNEVCTDETLSLFSASQPNKIFEQLGSHCWKRRSTELGTEVIKNTESITKLEKGTVDNQLATVAKVYYADSYSQDNNVFTLINPRSIDWTVDSQFDVTTTISDKYFIFNTTSDTIIYYAKSSTSENFTINVAHNGTNYFPYMANLQSFTLTTKDVETLGETEYVYSTDRNAYPDSGTSGLYEYIYVGVPFANARDSVQIETGTYVGTGAAGQSTPNTITFNRKPVVVFVCCNLSSSSTQAVFINPANITHVKDVQQTNVGDWSAHNTWNGNTLSWYSKASSSNGQLNVSGVTYTYMALCL